MIGDRTLDPFCSSPILSTYTIDVHGYIPKYEYLDKYLRAHISRRKKSGTRREDVRSHVSIIIIIIMWHVQEQLVGREERKE